MIDNTIQQIESSIHRSDSITPERKAELLRLLATLKSEISDLSMTDADQARSIAGFADLYAHEVTRGSRNPELLQHSLDGLRAAVAGFEKSHPRLVQVVNSISNTLSNLGI